MKTIDQKFAVGKVFRSNLLIDEALVERFADFSGDKNPIHVDVREARAYGYPRQVAHGAILVGLLSRLIGMDVPGPGALWMNQTLDWVSPVFVGDEIELTATIKQISSGSGVIILQVLAVNREGKVVMNGEAKVKLQERLDQSRSFVEDTTDRVALVTGASRGIGSAIAERLAGSGMRVAVNYREADAAATQIVEAIQAAGGSAHSFKADLSEETATRNMLQHVKKTYGRIDVVVHAATPTTSTVPLSELTYAEVERYLKVYLGGALTIMASLAPGMAERRFGRFIFLGTAYLFGIPPVGLNGYVVAKEALWGLVKGMAAELGPQGITVNMISPGLTVTDLTAGVPQRIKEVEARKSPLRRLATPQDAAELANFLASPAGGFINGANLPLTGGPI